VTSEGRTSQRLKVDTTEVDHSSTDERRYAADQTDTELQCRGHSPLDYD